KKMN
ncbi:cytosolic carboxypeptidase 3 isoform j precursor, partial [Daubentonia madagascariensis]